MVQLYIQQKASPLMVGHKSQKHNFFLIIIPIPHYITFYGPSQCRQEQEHKEEGQGLVRAATVLMNVALPRDAVHVLLVVTVLWCLPLIQHSRASQPSQLNGINYFGAGGYVGISFCFSLYVQNFT